MGLSVRVYETGSGVGGTWYWNRYPGARCDSESYIYCFSFSKELLQDWTWSGKFPEQPEILAYLEHVADRFDLRRNIRFNTRVTAATFQEDTNRWEISTDHGDRVTAHYLITGIGCISTGNVPHIEGLDSFRGDWYHTGAWPHEPVDFNGKRVAVIGTGSSGVQSIPVIARQAESPHRLPAHAPVHGPRPPPRRRPPVHRGRGQAQLPGNPRKKPAGAKAAAPTTPSSVRPSTTP